MALPERGIKIGELARRTEVTRATIHHYVAEGLLPEPTKTSRNSALYDPGCIERVLLIKGLQRQHRSSLAEVKAMLVSADGGEGIAHLRSILEAEAIAEQSSPLARPNDREPVSAEDLGARTGFTPEELERLERQGILASKKRGGKKVYDPLDVDVADALARLSEAGFDAEHGFHASDLVMYLDALRSLLEKEVALFFARTKADESSGDLLARARKGIERVTPLILALRRKLVGELIEKASAPSASDEKPRRRAAKARR